MALVQSHGIVKLVKRPKVVRHLRHHGGRGATLAGLAAAVVILEVEPDGRNQPKSAPRARCQRLGLVPTHGVPLDGYQSNYPTTQFPT